ncbi:hypothetical protein E3T55_11070 [Cryobacterium frigoriphilum]|uniref:Uncharacterized protein n=1 Tax=Cryobacterium frigoriphilum TaxID=1259150 RepID=A0A4R8ZZW7_9MICO|nr:hypothetical protein [Cryobacterium frigoriphilum]TFD49611.1 hypothetical protein E3T55_11070 [Cryobacterium frigoriphilum]
MLRALLTAIVSVALIGLGAPVAQSSSDGPGCYTNAPDRVDNPSDGDDVVICEYTSGGWIARNDSDTIWAVTSPVLRIFDLYKNEVRSRLFHTSAKSWYPYIFLAPGDEVIIPADAGGVRLSIQPDLALAWIMFDQLADEVEEQSTELIGDVVGGKSARRAALWQCSLAMYNAARELDESAMWQADPKSLWEFAQSSVEDGSECTTAWSKARKVKAEVPFPKYRNVVLEVTRDADLTAQAIARLSVAQDTLDNLGLRFVCSLPKIRGVGC